MRVAVIGSTGGWHAERLEHALRARGHDCVFAPVTRLVGRIDGGFGVRSCELALDACDVVIVRAIAPRTASAPCPARAGPFLVRASNPWPSMRGR